MNAKAEVFRILGIKWAGGSFDDKLVGGIDLIGSEDEGLTGAPVIEEAEVGAALDTEVEQLRGKNIACAVMTNPSMIVERVPN